MLNCSHCHNYGELLIYRYGRVIRVYCDCPSGDKRVEMIVSSIHYPHGFSCERLSDHPTLLEYYGEEETAEDTDT